ncbi:MAG: MutS protein msh4 [Thelocarpon superellum]|nr:MAG: MutS protein msh4 [Thelocarpon superellum]
MTELAASTGQPGGLPDTEAKHPNLGSNWVRHVRTIHKLTVFDPSQILMMKAAITSQSTMFRIIEENCVASEIVPLDRKYWAESTGVECIERLAFSEDIEAIKVSIEGSYFAICSIAAAVKYLELALFTSFVPHSLRISFQPSEGSMMIDLSTIQSLELIQNLRDAKSKHCLFGMLNETLTPMGARLLRMNVLQPLTDRDALTGRFDALAEITSKEDMFSGVRLGPSLGLITVPTKSDAHFSEQDINHIVVLKHFVDSVPAIDQALFGATSHLLCTVRRLCAREKTAPIRALIDQHINQDTTFERQPLGLRNQRIYAVKSGVNGLLDMARATFEEATSDMVELVESLRQEYGFSLLLKYETARQYYLRLSTSELAGRPLPAVFVNVLAKKSQIDCQTLDMMKQNLRIADANAEIVMLSSTVIETLTDSIRGHVRDLFMISEALAMLDMITSFGQLVTTKDYVQPELTDTLAVRAGRHPIREKVHTDRYIPNDIYATQQTRFQIITGKSSEQARVLTLDTNLVLEPRLQHEW